MKTNYIAIDTETGGYRPGRHALLSIAATTSWGAGPFLVHLWPADGYRIEQEAADVNGYTEAKWKERGAVSLFQGLERLVLWLNARLAEKKDARMLAHNAGYDRGFIDEACAITGLKFPVKRSWRCSMYKMHFLMDAGVIPEGRATLDRLGELAGLWPVGGRPETHEALQDAIVCLIGYQWLLSEEHERWETMMNRYVLERQKCQQLEMLLEQANKTVAATSNEEVGHD